MNNTPNPAADGGEELRAELAEIIYGVEDGRDNIAGRVHMPQVEVIMRLLSQAIDQKIDSIVGDLLKQQIPVMALTARKPHKEVQIQAIPVEVLLQKHKEANHE